MKHSTKTKAISSILNDINKGRLLLNHPIQRKPGQFTLGQKSLLIDSILRGYPIPSIYTVIEDENEYVIDGLQRLSIINSYVNNEFALSKKSKTLTYDGNEESINLSLLKFKDLPEVLQDKIKDTDLTLFRMEDCKEGEINEVFLRLNNGVPLNTPQKLRASLSTEMQAAIKEVIELDFFTKVAVLTKGTKLRAHDESMILQTLMLLNGNMDFSKKGMPAFLESYTYNQEDFDLIKNAIIELGEKLPEKSPNLKKSSIPMIIYALIKCPKELKDGYFEAIYDFSQNYNNGDTYDDYKELCNSGTISSSNVEKRVNYFLYLASNDIAEEAPKKEKASKKKS